MFEHKRQKLVPHAVFVKRMAGHAVFVIFLISGVLFAGTAGYHWLDGLKWVDALLNASMILGGMGPVDALTNDGAKLFASFYALFSGLLIVAVTGILLAPVMHRVLHAFHADEKDPK